MSLSRASKCFQLTNLAITLILPSTISWEWESVAALNILWIYLHSRVSTNTYHCALKIDIRNGVWHGMSDISMLLLRLYCSPFACFFFKINYLGLQFSVNIFYYCYITLEFLILHHNLVHAFCKSFNFSQSLCKSASMTTFPLRSTIFWIKSYFFNEFNADSDKFKIFVLLSPILSNLLKCLKV